MVSSTKELEVERGKKLLMIWSVFQFREDVKPGSVLEEWTSYIYYYRKEEICYYILDLVCVDPSHIFQQDIVIVYSIHNMTIHNN